MLKTLYDDNYDLMAPAEVHGHYGTPRDPREELLVHHRLLAQQLPLKLEVLATSKKISQ